MLFAQNGETLAKIAKIAKEERGLSG